MLQITCQYHKQTKNIYFVNLVSLNMNIKNKLLSQDGVSDICISGTDRNRALNGDIVAVELHDKDKWKV